MATDYAKELRHLAYTKNKDAINIGGLIPGRFNHKRGRLGVYFTLIDSLEPNPNIT